jgi:hypothetical protein
MSKQQLLTIFDANNSGTISDKELNAKGLDGDELLEIKAHLGTVEIETEVRQTKTGFSVEQLAQMTKPQLLTIFDANNSGTISGQELKLKGLDGDEISEIKAHVSSLEIEEKEEVVQKDAGKNNETVKPARKKQKINGVTFYEDEVLKIERDSYENFWTGQNIKTVKVTTPYGTFEYISDSTLEDNSQGSILGNTVKNMRLHSYTGTEKKDKLNLKSSMLAHIYIENGGKDIISYDKDSYARDVSYWHHDDNDEIRFYKEDGSYEVHKNPYRRKN